jgi:hypothetical protein
MSVEKGCSEKSILVFSSVRPMRLTMSFARAICFSSGNFPFVRTCFCFFVVFSAFNFFKEFDKAFF